jgi:orotate phosphoribosyltransferase
MNEVSQLHWMKHKAIVKWEVDTGDFSRVKLLLTSDINKIFNPEYKLKFGKKKFMDFMCECITDLENELETVFDICSIMGSEATWKLGKVVLKVFGNTAAENYGYVKNLDEMLIARRDLKKKLTEEDKKTNTPYDIDANIRHERNGRKENNSVYISYKSAAAKKYPHVLIGEEKYRIKLNNYIKRKSMLRQGCYEHKKLKIFSWLDSFEFHQHNFLLHITSNIIVKHAEQKKIDLIIGLGLKGAKIATVVGLKIEKPVYFFVDNDIKTGNLDINKSYNIAMITDCLITGETALSCYNKLKEGKFNIKISGAYCVFIRNHIHPEQNSNKLMKSKIPIYAINDTYTYTTCSFEDKDKCPLYISYGEKCYERTYKL